MLHVSAYTDDRKPTLVKPDFFPERAFVRPEPFGQHLVDDSDAGRALDVALAEVAPLPEWNPERGKIAGTGRTNLRAVLDAGRRRQALDLKAVAPIVPTERKVSGGACGLHAGQCADASERLPVKAQHGDGVGITLLH